MHRMIRMICVWIIIMLLAVTTAVAEPALTTGDLTAAEREIYNQVQDYIDQGDAKAAALVLADQERTESVFALLYAQQPEIWNVVMLEAMNHFDEAGDVLHLLLLRTKGYITDELFGAYRQQRGLEKLPVEEQDPVDGYLLDELVRVYKRGGANEYILIDLRYWGLIDHEMHQALIGRLRLDYMDDVNLATYVPRMNYLISHEELTQYNLIKECIDQGDMASVAEMMLEGSVSSNLYAYMLKNDSEVLDLGLAYCLLDYAEEGKDECIVQLCADGFISDRCFDYYWEMIGCELPETSRADERYEGIDMYLLHEIDMILKYRRQDDGFVKALWMSEILDETMRGFIVEYFGGWEELTEADAASVQETVADTAEITMEPQHEAEQEYVAESLGEQQATEEAEDPFPCTGRTLKGKVNVRKECSTRSSLAGRVNKKGTQVTVLEMVMEADTPWYYVKVGKIEGYIRGDLVELLTVEE